MRASGQDVSESFLGEVKAENRVIVEDGVAKLPDRSSFAGSVTNGEKMFEVLHKKYGYSVEDASKMLSENPARYIGLEKLGKIERGYRADLAIIDNFKVIKTIKNGRCLN
jgi:N-acetylglucosamine-6-phosphate deacetylase